MKSKESCIPTAFATISAKVPKSSINFTKNCYVNNAETPELKASQSIAALYGYCRLGDSMFDEIVWYSDCGASVNKLVFQQGLVFFRSSARDVSCTDLLTTDLPVDSSQVPTMQW